VRVPLSRYGRRELWVYGMILVGLSVVSGVFLWYVTVVPVMLLGFLLYFFRDPEREAPEGAKLLVSPADGRVTEIAECEQEELGGKVCRVSIFLSLFDVHLNRAPCSGRVAETTYRPGKFLNAMKGESARVNESNTIIIESDEAPGVRVAMKQVAGVLARRIVCAVEPGSRVGRGERVGMIKFGSRTDLSVPAGALKELKVAVGDRVRAGKSVIGVLQ
jgi:phosphatidylserine decarboxylase